MCAQRRRRRNAKPTQLTPEYLLAKDAALQGKPIGKKYADATQCAMRRVEKLWNKYCGFMKKNPLECLKQCSAENFRCFLNWRLLDSGISKKSTIELEWRFLRLIYRQKTGQRPDDYVGKDVADYIDGPLTEEHDLDLSVRSKPVMGVDDLLVVLHYHWALDKAAFPHERQRAQLSLLLLMIAYTSSRPGALIESGCLRGSNEALCYKDVRVLVIKNPDDPDHNMIVMKVTLRYMKGKRGKSQPTTYLFHERDDNLAICPILQFLALAFADNAFEAEGVNSLGDIFRLRINAPRNSLQLKWKSSWQDTPIFRRTVRTLDGIQISPNKALQYDTFVKYLRRLGQSAGFGETLTPYCIRRGTANAVDDVATTAERNQVLGHSRSDIFLRYYISERVKRDVQSAYLGCPAQDALIRAVGRMKIKHHPRIVEIQKKKEAVSAEIRSQYGKIKNAEGTEIYRHYIQLSSSLANERQSLRSSKLEDIRRNFFSTINTIEIEQQLSGHRDPDTKDLGIEDSKATHFSFDQRSRLAEVLFVFSDNTIEDRSQYLDRRVHALADLVALCALREAPRQERSPSCDVWSTDEVDDISDPELFPLICSGTQCLFCLGDAQLSHNARTFLFSRTDHLRRHVQKTHLKFIATNDVLICPHPVCRKKLQGIEHFKNHAAQVHHIFL